MKAMILAAGYGKRMLPLTNLIPKPLVQFNNKYLIEYSIENLKKAEITQLVINLHHLGDQIKNVLENGSRWGVNISYSEEPELLDTGGGIVQAINKNLLGTEPFIVVSSDVISDFDFSSLPTKLSKLAHSILVPNPSFNPNGDFSLNNNYLNLPNNDTKLNYNYAGISIFDPKFFLDPPSKIFPLVTCIKKAIKTHQVTGEIYTGSWKNIGTLEDLQSI